jgi:hypothetical protein
LRFHYQYVEVVQLSEMFCDKNKLSVGNADDRRGSVMTVSDAGSELDARRRMKYGGPLTGTWTIAG